MFERDMAYKQLAFDGKSRHLTFVQCPLAPQRGPGNRRKSFGRLTPRTGMRRRATPTPASGSKQLLG